MNKQERSATPQSKFLCIDEDMYPRCAKQCAECQTIEERERHGQPPADEGEAEQKGGS